MAFRGRAGNIPGSGGNLLHRVDVQGSLWNSAQKKSFTLNCGVYVPAVTSTFRNAPEPKQPKLTDCCISVRPGMLRGTRCDIWWEISTSDSEEKEALVRREVNALIVETVLPFLERFETEEQVARFLSEKRAEEGRFVDPRAESMQLAYAAVLWRTLGDSERCSRCLAEAAKYAPKGPLEGFMDAFAARMKC